MIRFAGLHGWRHPQASIVTLLFHYGFGIPKQAVEIGPPPGPIFPIARLPQLTPTPRLPSAIDVQPDDDETPH